MLLLVLGELVQTTAEKWITHPPHACPNGHTLSPGEVLVGHQVCLGHTTVAALAERALTHRSR